MNIPAPPAIEVLFKEDKIIQAKEENKEIKIGRPFKGDTELSAGKENNVKEKRSIFRILKKFYQKNDHQTVSYAGKRFTVK